MIRGQSSQPLFTRLPVRFTLCFGQNGHREKRRAANSHRNDLLHGRSSAAAKKTNRGMIIRNNQPLQFLPGIVRQVSVFSEGSTQGGGRDLS